VCVVGGIDVVDTGDGVGTGVGTGIGAVAGSVVDSIDFDGVSSVLFA
jgi:hypothetical protein